MAIFAGCGISPKRQSILGSNCPTLIEIFMILKGLSKSKVGFKASDKLMNESRDRGTKIVTPFAAFGAKNVLTIHSCIRWWHT